MSHNDKSTAQPIASAADVSAPSDLAVRMAIEAAIHKYCRGADRTHVATTTANDIAALYARAAAPVSGPSDEAIAAIARGVDAGGNGKHVPFPFSAAPVSGQGATSDTLLYEWENCQRMANLPSVDEALRSFSEDPTGDGGVYIVREVLRELCIDSRPRSEDSRAKVPKLPPYPEADKIVRTSAGTQRYYMPDTLTGYALETLELNGFAPTPPKADNE